MSVMTETGSVASIDFVLPCELEARQPAEARGLRRDQVRLLVGVRSTNETSHHRFDDLPDVLTPGDVLIVNTSATIPAAIDIVGSHLTLHVSTELPDGTWVVELRERAGSATVAYSGGVPNQHLRMTGGKWVRLIRPYSRGRLWVADIDTPDVPAYLTRHARPIRYSYVDRDWPISTYSSVFGVEPGSAEMPSASRPFTHALVTRLARRGIVFAPILLHTGVASPEAHERPYPERFRVPADTARLVNEARAAGRRVIAVGTTAVRAIESAADETAVVRAAEGWTSLVVTPTSGVRVVDGLVTGFHEPRASHLDMLAAVAGEPLLKRVYADALEGSYLWHEFGDINLLLDR